MLTFVMCCLALRMQDVEKVRLNHPDKIPVSCILEARIFNCHPFLCM